MALPTLGILAGVRPEALSPAVTGAVGQERRPNPSALVQAWPMQHPELATLLWSGLALVVFVPLAVRMYASKQR